MNFFQNQNLKVWFRCQLCRGLFQTVSEFVEHKKQWHLTEFQKINSNCILFEEAKTKQMTEIERIQSETTELSKTTRSSPRVKNPHVLITQLTSKKIQAASQKSKSLFKGSKSNPSSNLLERKSKVTKSQSFQCSKLGCSKICKTLRSHRMHLATHAKSKSNDSPSHECELCNRTFSYARSLKKHRSEIHNQFRPFYCVHRGCGKSFKRIDGLQSHLETHKDLNDRPTFPCQICGKICLWQRSLNQHYREVHGTDHPFTCPQPDCKKSFKRREYVRSHFQTHADPNDRPIFACKICKYPFMHHKTLRKHSLSVHGTRM